MKKGLTLLLLSFLSVTLAACATIWPTEEHENTMPPRHVSPTSTNMTPPPSDVGVPVDDSLLTPAAKPASVTTSAVSTASGPLGGEAANRMDAFDRSKLSRALDGGIGKTSQWTNANTGITFAVTPTGITHVNGNPYCRQYTVTMTATGMMRENHGVACLNDNSNWQAM